MCKEMAGIMYTSLSTSCQVKDVFYDVTDQCLTHSHTLTIQLSNGLTFVIITVWYKFDPRKKTSY